MEKGKIYKTNKWNFCKEIDGNLVYFDESGKIMDLKKSSSSYRKWVVENLKAVRSDSKIYWVEVENIEEWEKNNAEAGSEKSNLSFFTQIENIKVYIDGSTFQLKAKIGEDLVDIEKVSLQSIKDAMPKIEKLRIELKKQKVNNYRLGSRVLLYGPTGTGKTYDFLQSVVGRKDIDQHYVCTITEWTEDVDFLSYMFPTEKWLKILEKEVVWILRDASKGKKVAILFDELNRGSKSLLNFILKLIDAVDWEHYLLDNFMGNEQIKIPIENVLFFATMNLWGKYVGTSALDEALFDRFNVIQYKGYNPEVEEEMLKAFGELAWDAKTVVDYIRDCYKNADIRSTISTRWIKEWAQAFINTAKERDDFFKTFEQVLLYRLINVDAMWVPAQKEIAVVVKQFSDLKYNI